MEKPFTCGGCNMTFRSATLLKKHEDLFCIRTETGNKIQTQRPKSESVTRISDRVLEPKQTKTPDLVQMKIQRRSFIRSEEKPQTTRSVQVDGAALLHLTDEVHKLRTSFEENVSNWSRRTTDPEVSGRHPGHSQRLKEMKEMTTLHQHQLALIRTHNLQLEQQRDELAHQVTVLSEQNNTTHLESLLMELREQEERNEETLQQLAEHLHQLHLQKVSVSVDQTESGRNTKLHGDEHKLVSSVDGPLSAQIKALRQTYMESGGSDPNMVAQMIDLQAEAQSLERNQPMASDRVRKKKVKPPHQDPSWELLILEQENQRLEEEILRIQLSRGRNDDYEAALRTELDQIHKENLHHITSLEAEMERSKEAPRSCRKPPPPLQTRPHIQAPLSLLQMRSFSPSGRSTTDLLDSLGPAPYDPVAGFVVFFDLVLGVDASQRMLRLVAALYSEGLEVGAPTPLPPVQCILGGASPPYAHNLTNWASLSIKQPVPRMQPASSLCLVVEVQAAADPDVYNQEVFKLTSCGWTQLELFDQYNQLRSGHWRAPVRSLPIKPSLNVAQLNSIPQVGNMELCVRLVNGRDGDVQTLVKSDVNNTRHYRYPAVGASASAPHQTDQLSSLMNRTDQTDQTLQS